MDIINIIVQSVIAGGTIISIFAFVLERQKYVETKTHEDEKTFYSAALDLLVIISQQKDYINRNMAEIQVRNILCMESYYNIIEYISTNKEYSKDDKYRLILEQLKQTRNRYILPQPYLKFTKNNNIIKRYRLFELKKCQIIQQNLLAYEQQVNNVEERIYHIINTYTNKQLIELIYTNTTTDEKDQSIKISFDNIINCIINNSANPVKNDLKKLEHICDDISKSVEDYLKNT